MTVIGKKISGMTPDTSFPADAIFPFVASSLDPSQNYYGAYTARVNLLLGTTMAAGNLGTFTGATIADNSSVKTALQALETAQEAGLAARPTSATLVASDGADLVGFSHAETYSAGTLGAKEKQIVSIVDAPFNVTAATSATFNVAAIQDAIDTGAARIMIPDYVVVMNGQVELGDGQCLEGMDKTKSILRKSVDTVGPLVYANGKTDCGIRNLSIDGVRSQTTTYAASKWNAFFTDCTRPFVENCYLYGSLTDNLVFELCVDSIVSNVRSDDSNKGGIYWSACDGGICVNATCDNNGSTVSALGSGFIISNTWNLSLFGIKAKNNYLGQVILSRGNSDIQIAGATLGDRLQTRGTYSIHMIGETTTGTVHGVTYDGVTLYGTDNSTFSDVMGYLPPLLNYASNIDFFDLKIESVANAQLHAAILGKTDKIRFRGGRLYTDDATGVGISLNNFGGGVTTNMLSDGVDFKSTSATRIADASGGASWTERLSLVDGVPVGNTAIADVSVTATSGSLPTPNGSVTIANAATPTNAELLEFIMEERAKNNTLRSQLRAAGLLAT